MKIGMIGLGAMGFPITKCLLKAGFEVYAFDVAEKTLDEAAANGAHPCPDVAKVGAEAETILCSLPNAAIVESVMQEALAGEELKAKVWIDLSSIAPESAKKFARMAAGRGIEYMDCPVSGGVHGAESGTLTIMAGGPEETLEKARPALEAIGKKIYHVGGVGAGSGMKMVNNFMLGCNMAAAAEALVMGSKIGLDLDTMYEIVKNSSGRSFIIENKIPNFISKRRFEGGFAIDLAYKDLGLAMETAKHLSMPVCMGSMAVQMFETARAKGYGREDITALLKVEEELMDVEVK